MKKFVTNQYGVVRFHHSRTDTPNPEEFERHCHNSYELIYVVHGNGKYIVEGSEYPLCPNTVLFLRPYEYHYVCPEPTATYERYVVHFSGDLLLDASEELSFVKPQQSANNGIYFPSESVPSMIRTQFETLDLDFISDTEKSEISPTRAETVLRTVVNQILILLSYMQADLPQKAETKWVGEIMRYLNENLSQDISLEETARHFFVSKYHLCHTFREHTGISVFSYLTTKRIAQAEQLLEDGIPAADVAYRVGFRDYSVFYRAYRKLTGESPSKAKGKLRK